MIPYIEVLDKYTRKPFEVIEPSEFWCELSYYGEGEFEIYTNATNRTLASLQNGNYIKLPNKPYLWVIEKVEKTFDAERGLMISATGREAKAILSKRIIAFQTQIPTSLVTAINDLLIKHAGTNAAAARKIQGLSVEASSVVQAIDETQVSYENLLTYTDELAKTYSCGTRLYIDGTDLKYKLYKGTDKSDTAIFSQMFDNLLSSAYSVNESTFKNFAYVGGQGEGSARIMDSVDLENETDVDRCEMFVDAKDISSKYTDSQGVEQELDLTDPSDLATYKSWLKERAKQTLSEYTRIEAFNGVIDTTNTTLVFGVDYSLGDLVRVQDNRIGVYITPRVIKYTINQTSNEFTQKIDYGA